MNEHFEEARKAVVGELAAVTGMELGMEDYIATRFSQDKRLEEVSRILCSSHIPVIKAIDRPDLKYVVHFSRPFIAMNMCTARLIKLRSSSTTLCG